MYTAVAKTNAQLKGEYKVDILDDKGQLIEEGEWFPNFITQTGLFYPKQYSFADCFRFLSVGGGVSPTANSMTTTGAFGWLFYRNRSCGFCVQAK